MPYKKVSMKGGFKDLTNMPFKKLSMKGGVTKCTNLKEDHWYTSHT